MWVLTEVIRARQAAARIGRFDVSPTTPLAGALASRHHCRVGRGFVVGRAMVLCRDRRLLFSRWTAATISTSSPTREPRWRRPEGGSWLLRTPGAHVGSCAPALAFVPAAPGGLPCPARTSSPTPPAPAGSAGQRCRPRAPPVSPSPAGALQLLWLCCRRVRWCCSLPRAEPGPRRPLPCPGEQPRPCPRWKPALPPARGRWGRPPPRLGGRGGAGGRRREPRPRLKAATLVLPVPARLFVEGG